MKPFLSIVIPCKDDRRIVECLKSIDYPNASIEIVLNGATAQFSKWLDTKIKDYKYTTVIVHSLPKPNLSWALEYGTRHSKYDLVLYMDSDCRFKKGAINGFLETSKKYNVSQNVFKGEVVFEKGKTYLSHIIAASRSYHTAETLTAYKPPLMISKEILPKIGGYAFNKKLIWREDSDLDNRVRTAKIAIIPVNDGIIYHRAISLKTDLRSTFRYGIGLAIANVLKIKLTEVPRSTCGALRSKGVIVALYMLFRNRVYDAGYIYARIRLMSKKYLHEKISR